MRKRFAGLGLMLGGAGWWVTAGKLGGDAPMREILAADPLLFTGLLGMCLVGLACLVVGLSWLTRGAA